MLQGSWRMVQGSQAGTALGVVPHAGTLLVSEGRRLVQLLSRAGSSRLVRGGAAAAAWGRRAVPAGQPAPAGYQRLVHNCVHSGLPGCRQDAGVTRCHYQPVTARPQWGRGQGLSVSPDPDSLLSSFALHPLETPASIATPPTTHHSSTALVRACSCPAPKQAGDRTRKCSREAHAAW